MEFSIPLPIIEIPLYMKIYFQFSRNRGKSMNQLMHKGRSQRYDAAAVPMKSPKILIKRSHLKFLPVSPSTFHHLPPSLRKYLSQFL